MIFTDLYDNLFKKHEAFIVGRGSLRERPLYVTHNNTLAIIAIIIYIILMLYSLYLSFKCNKGFRIQSLLFSLFLAPCHMAWLLNFPCF